MKSGRRIAAAGVVGLLLALIGSVPVSASPPGTADERIRVLLLSGANNHDWRSTTPRLVAIFEQTGNEIELARTFDAYSRFLRSEPEFADDEGA